MVNSDSPRKLEPIERKIVQFLEEGQQVTLDDLGGISELVRNAVTLSTSPLLPEVLPALVSFGDQASDADLAVFRETFVALIAGTSDEFVLTEMIDVLFESRPLPGDSDEVCFTSLLSKAQDKNLSGLARGIALEGCFRWAVSNRRWQLRLLDYLLGIPASGDEELLRRSAKICGVAHSFWKEDGLVERLADFFALDCCAAEASFELGMAALTQAMDAPSRQETLAAFNRAHTWFATSIERAEVNPEAQLYCDCLELLTAYDAGLSSDTIAATANKISQNAFDLRSWSNSPDMPNWLGMRRLQALYWNQLALSLNGLIPHLDGSAGALLPRSIASSKPHARSVITTFPSGWSCHKAETNCRAGPHPRE